VESGEIIDSNQLGLDGIKFQHQPTCNKLSLKNLKLISSPMPRLGSN
jgi:hypothetical protein